MEEASFLLSKKSRVDASYGGSISIEITLPTSPYNILQNDSKGHGCYFKKYYYSNIWIIHVQSPTNLPKSMWKYLFNVANVILKYGSPKRKTHKVHRINASSKTFKNYVFGTKIEKQTKIATHMDLWKYGQILTIQSP